MDIIDTMLTIYFLGIGVYIIVYLYMNRFTYFFEGLSWPPLKPLIGFWWAGLRGYLWPFFFIRFLFDKFKK